MLHTPTETRARTSAGIVLMCVGVASLCVNDALAKTLTAHYSPFQIQFLRNLIALPFAILIAVYAVDLLRVGHLPGYAGYTGIGLLEHCWVNHAGSGFDGALRSATVQRWGPTRFGPGKGGRYTWQQFRVDAYAERTFSGITIPVRFSATWVPEEGPEFEFFRAEITRATFG